MKLPQTTYFHALEAAQVARSREIRTAIKCATWLAILFGGEPDIVGAVVVWLLD